MGFIPTERSMDLWSGDGTSLLYQSVTVALDDDGSLPLTFGYDGKLFGLHYGGPVRGTAEWYGLEGESG